VTITPARILAWAALSFGLFVGALFAVLPAIAFVSAVVGMPHPGAWSLGWGGLSLLGVLVAARVVFGAWLRPHPVGIVLAATGISLAAALSVALQEWEIARFGYPDPEYVGLTAGLFAVLIGLAVAAFAAFLVPPRLIGWPLAAAAIGALGTGVIFATNLPGLADGIAPESWPLAVCMGLSGVYALIATGLVVHRALDRTNERAT